MTRHKRRGEGRRVKRGEMPRRGEVVTIWMVVVVVAAAAAAGAREPYPHCSAAQCVLSASRTQRTSPAFGHPKGRRRMA